MKHFILFTAILFSLAACKKTATQATHSSIVGKWKLSEYLVDPGDGSGTWQRADSLNPGYLEFNGDGTLSVSPTSANNWDHYRLTGDSTIIFFRGSDQFARSYHLSRLLLTLTGGCFEPCGERYIPAQ